MLKLPSMSVVVPKVFFSTQTIPAPITGAPSESIIFPESLIPCGAAREDFSV